MVSGTHLITVGIGGPAVLLAAAFGFQYFGDLAPCPLCIWQRWPHAAAIAIGILFSFWRRPPIAVLAASVLACGTGIAGYHVGVENGWWPGLSSCAGASLNIMSGKELLDFSQPVNVTRCDEVAWSFLGLSMAAWNGLASAALACVWLALARDAVLNRAKQPAGR